MPNLDLNQIEELASNLRAVSDVTYSAAVAVADVYNATSSYDIGDYCIKSTLLYKCNTAIPSGEVWNNNHWDEICVSDELNEIRSSVIHIGTSAPSNPNIQLWLDTDEPGMTGVSSVNSKTGTVILDADDVGAMHWDLLWTNASPTSDFAAQTIICDTSYDSYGILYKYSSNTEGLGTTILSGNVGNYIHMLFFSGTESDFNGVLAMFKRNAEKSANGITFSAGYLSQQGGAWTTNYSANKCIPLYIYGIKGVTT